MSAGSPSRPSLSAAVSRSPGGIIALSVVLADGADVLVAAPGEAHHHDCVRRSLRGQLFGGVQRVTGLQCGDDPLEPAETVEGGDRLLIVGGEVAHSAAVTQRAVLRSNTRIVEAGADRMRRQHLAVLVLH